MNEVVQDQLLEELERILHSQNTRKLETFIKKIRPFDRALLFERLSNIVWKKRITEALDNSGKAELLSHLHPEDQVLAISFIERSVLGSVLDEMQNDDLARMLDHLQNDQAETLVKVMSPEEADIVQKILSYPEESAGRLMTNRVVWINPEMTVTEAVQKLRQYSKIFETIHYLYVVNDKHQIEGVVSYRDLLLAEQDDLIKRIMSDNVMSVKSYIDQEEVARLIEQYDLIAMPVVDDNEKLIGLITVDDVIDVLIQEATEDIERLSGSGKEITFKTNAFTAFARRLPWLVLLLFIGLVSGSIISGFEETLASVVALAFFMPMIAGMTGNTGTQSLAVVVRGLTTNRIDKLTVTKLLIRELLVGIMIGATCGVLIAAIGYFWQGSITIGLIVGLSLLTTLIIGTLAGTIIPLILHRFKIDPAIASGPLITTLNDILSLLIYFGIATALLTRFPI
ncbi:magnesium transporter [Jeotgalibacillus proteolyticus]|uniref:Magnesium transporter MgtE n=1 Tax=Jeotgalibacillus proteolyticus TaxID=2082395 RepID=A0A2S5GCV7_9BACL|nr:magnesium transporter [Jeotgalibacillus proteolyticus]PPA70872.1 magnesium transporter [Jeotgalibacillus proteolyticus]